MLVRGIPAKRSRHELPAPVPWIIFGYLRGVSRVFVDQVPVLSVPPSPQAAER